MDGFNHKKKDGNDMEEYYQLHRAVTDLFDGGVAFDRTHCDNLAYCNERFAEAACPEEIKKAYCRMLYEAREEAPNPSKLYLMLFKLEMAYRRACKPLLNNVEDFMLPAGPGYARPAA